MNEPVIQALENERTIDITTQGKRSGEPSRIEIWFHNVDGRVYITGTPGRRDWYANLVAHPRFTFHLKDSIVVDLDAIAVPITDQEERRRILSEVTPRVGASNDLETWLEGAPLVAVDFERK